MQAHVQLHALQSTPVCLSAVLFQLPAFGSHKHAQRAAKGALLCTADGEANWVRTSTTCFFPARAFISQPTCQHKHSVVCVQVRARKAKLAHFTGAQPEELPYAHTAAL